MSDRGNNSQSNNAALLEELTEFCRSDSLSEGGLREIIERHGAAPNKNIDDTSIDYEFFHEACFNEKVTEGIFRCLLKYFPNAARATGGEGQLPIHSFFGENKNITLGMVQLLIDAYPDSLSHETNRGCMPLHQLCDNEYLDEEGGLEILKLLVERYPGALRHFDRDGDLPIHIAAAWHLSLDFCRILIEAYPGSERQMNSNNGSLPFHAACLNNTVATVEYLYQLYPESIHVADNDGYYPIHHAIMGVKFREDNPETAIEMVQFLLHCDPDVALQKVDDKFTLHYFFEIENEIMETNPNQARLNTALKVLQMIYDTHPEAIEDNRVRSNTICAEIQTFIDTQLAYAHEAKDQTLMTTRDEDGRLALHRALRDNVTLGSIKLLVKGNPSAICTFDKSGMIPLHVACWHHESASVVEYLIKLDPTSLRARDFDDDTALHYACRGANYAIIALLLDKYGSMYVSKRNAHGQLPIDLLFAGNVVSDREDVKYTESIFRLLQAYPAMMNCIPNTTTTSHSDSKLSGKKRKIDNIQEEGEGYYSYLSSVKRKLIRTFWGR